MNYIPIYSEKIAIFFSILGIPNFVIILAKKI